MPNAVTLLKADHDPIEDASPAETAARATVSALNARCRGASPQDILSAAFEAFPDDIALVSSFGTEAAVLLHLASKVNPSVPVVFLETGKHFAQTLSYRKKLSERLGLSDVRLIRPDGAEAKSEDPTGDLWSRNIDACCDLRKVRPLDRALSGFSTWITGRKRYQGGARQSLPAFETDGAGKVKVNPLADWTRDDVQTHFDAYDLPRHPLEAEGFPSIGCWPCTSPSSAEDPRAGRWAGQDKTECGIHVSSVAARSTPL